PALRSDGGGSAAPGCPPGWGRAGGSRPPFGAGPGPSRRFRGWAGARSAASARGRRGSAAGVRWSWFLLPCLVTDNLLQRPETPGLFLFAQPQQKAQALGFAQPELALPPQPAVQGGGGYPQGPGQVFLFVAAGLDLCVQPVLVDHALPPLGDAGVDLKSMTQCSTKRIQSQPLRIKC